MEHQGNMGRLIFLKNDGRDGNRYVLKQDKCTIGASESATIRIKMQDPRIKDIHCVVDVDSKGAAIVTNKGPMHLLQINGQNVMKSKSLQHGDIISILDKSIRYEKEQNISKTLSEKKISYNTRTPSRRMSAHPMTPMSTKKTPLNQKRTIKAKENTPIIFKTPQGKKFESSVKMANNNFKQMELSEKVEPSKEISTPQVTKTFTVNTPKSAIKPTLRNEAMKNSMKKTPKANAHSSKLPTFNESIIESESLAGAHESLKTPVMDNAEQEPNFCTPQNNTSVVLIESPLEDVTPVRSQRSLAKNLKIQRLLKDDESVVILDTPTSKTPKSAKKGSKVKTPKSAMKKTKLINEIFDKDVFTSTPAKRWSKPIVLDDTGKEVSVLSDFTEESIHDASPINKTVESLRVSRRNSLPVRSSSKSKASIRLSTSVDSFDQNKPSRKSVSIFSFAETPEVNSTPSNANKCSLKSARRSIKLETNTPKPRLSRRSKKLIETTMGDVSSSAADSTTSVRKTISIDSVKKGLKRARESVGSLLPSKKARYEKTLDTSENISESPESYIPLRKAMTEPRRRNTSRMSRRSLHVALHQPDETNNSLLDSSSFVYFTGNQIANYNNSSLISRESHAMNDESDKASDKTPVRECMNETRDLRQRIINGRRLSEVPLSGNNKRKNTRYSLGIVSTKILSKTPKGRLSGRKALTRKSMNEMAVAEISSSKKMSSNFINVSTTVSSDPEEESLSEEEESVPVSSRKSTRSLGKASAGGEENNVSKRKSFLNMSVKSLGWLETSIDSAEISITDEEMNVSTRSRKSLNVSAKPLNKSNETDENSFSRKSLNEFPEQIMPEEAEVNVTGRKPKKSSSRKSLNRSSKALDESAEQLSADEAVTNISRRKSGISLNVSAKSNNSTHEISDVGENNVSRKSSNRSSKALDESTEQSADEREENVSRRVSRESLNRSSKALLNESTKENSVGINVSRRTSRKSLNVSAKSSNNSPHESSDIEENNVSRKSSNRSSKALDESTEHSADEREVNESRSNSRKSLNRSTKVFLNESTEENSPDVEVMNISRRTSRKTFNVSAKSLNNSAHESFNVEESNVSRKSSNRSSKALDESTEHSADEREVNESRSNSRKSLNRSTKVFLNESTEENSPDVEVMNISRRTSRKTFNVSAKSLNNSAHESFNVEESNVSRKSSNRSSKALDESTNQSADEREENLSRRVSVKSLNRSSKALLNESTEENSPDVEVMNISRRTSRKSLNVSAKSSNNSAQESSDVEENNVSRKSSNRSSKALDESTEQSADERDQNVSRRVSRKSLNRSSKALLNESTKENSPDEVMNVSRRTSRKSLNISANSSNNSAQESSDVEESNVSRKSSNRSSKALDESTEQSADEREENVSRRFSKKSLNLSSKALLNESTEVMNVSRRSSRKSLNVSTKALNNSAQEGSEAEENISRKSSNRSSKASSNESAEDNSTDVEKMNVSRRKSRKSLKKSSQESSEAEENVSRTSSNRSSKADSDESTEESAGETEENVSTHLSRQSLNRSSKVLLDESANPTSPYEEKMKILGRKSLRTTKTNEDTSMNETTEMNNSRRKSRKSVFIKTEYLSPIIKSPITKSEYQSPITSMKLNRETPKGPNNDLTDIVGLRRLMKTPKVPKTPKDDLSDPKGIKTLLRTPKVQKEPINDLSNPLGVKRLLKTPKVQKEPLNDLTNPFGVKRLLKTPKVQKGPLNDLSDPKGIKRILKTPKRQREPENDLTNPRGVKRLMKTPKVQREPENDLTNPRGVKKLMKTPKLQKEPINDLRNVYGVKQLLRTPRVQNEPKNDLSNPLGVKRLMRTPKYQKGPKNDLSNPFGVKKLMRLPFKNNQPLNDLSDFEGVNELYGGDDDLHVSGVTDNELFPVAQMKTYERKSNAETSFVAEIEDYTVPPQVEKWVEVQANLLESTDFNKITPKHVLDDDSDAGKENRVKTTRSGRKLVSNNTPRQHKILKDALNIDTSGVTDDSAVELVRSTRSRKNMESTPVEVRPLTRSTRGNKKVAEEEIVKETKPTTRPTRSRRNKKEVESDEVEESEIKEDAKSTRSRRNNKKVESHVTEVIDISDEWTPSKEKTTRGRRINNKKVAVKETKRATRSRKVFQAVEASDSEKEDEEESMLSSNHGKAQTDTEETPVQEVKRRGRRKASATDNDTPKPKRTARGKNAIDETAEEEAAYEEIPAARTTRSRRKVQMVETDDAVTPVIITRRGRKQAMSTEVTPRSAVQEKQDETEEEAVFEEVPAARTTRSRRKVQTVETDDALTPVIVTRRGRKQALTVEVTPKPEQEEQTDFEIEEPKARKRGRNIKEIPKIEVDEIETKPTRGKKKANVDLLQEEVSLKKVKFDTPTKGRRGKKRILSAEEMDEAALQVPVETKKIARTTKKDKEIVVIDDVVPGIRKSSRRKT